LLLFLEFKLVMTRKRGGEPFPTADAATGAEEDARFSVAPPSVAAALDVVGCTMMLTAATTAAFGTVGFGLLSFTVTAFDAATGTGVLRARRRALPFLHSAAASVASFQGRQCRLTLEAG
jgi:hypothetical protein